ncbi:MAG: YdcF family protein [Candidatus Sulfotelmatobacter sp.]
MKRLLALTLLFVIAVVLCAKAGSFLIVDQPRPSDVILVLAGETNLRPARALQLLSQGFGRRIVLDVPVNSTIYEFTQVQLAQQYIHDLPQGASVSICSTAGLSTKDESKDAGTCLAREGARSVLIVTSDFHTRRALSVFRRELPQYSFSVAAARDDQQFGARWWTHRQWAKIFLDEWLRLLWWKSIDQWRVKS